uniref:Uncharacterized protein n=1 Tax=Cryptococcus bacillisporus CA1280 TaxID=1296109 RepID=A0A0D0VVU4_CRYGA|nr:hypothetical protein I312_00609 [Cryptococcus bacillisporus CA1280]
MDVHPAKHIRNLIRRFPRVLVQPPRRIVPSFSAECVQKRCWCVGHDGCVGGCARRVGLLGDGQHRRGRRAGDGAWVRVRPLGRYEKHAADG